MSQEKLKIDQTYGRLVSQQNDTNALRHTRGGNIGLMANLKKNPIVSSFEKMIDSHLHPTLSRA